jgi:aspartyl-tRNA(Asn)/glutamyl-tRNA(Gln) amidotransferase subunit A
MALAEQALAGIGNSHLHAFVAVTEERALAEADRADAELRAGIDRGPLHGIPYAAKELFDIEGLRTNGQSRLATAPARRDAAAIERLSVAGAVLVGRTATYELAIEPRPSLTGPFPPARNPHDIERSTGGSSSGSAAAVAGGLVPLALGTDTGGSTYGRVSRRGVLPLSFSLDHVGPMTRSVADTVLALDALAGSDPDDRTAVETAPPLCTAALGRDVAGMRLAYARRFVGSDGGLDIRSALDACAERFAEMGVVVEEIDLPEPALFDAAATVIIQAEAFALHRAALRRTPESFGQQAFRHLVAGAVLSAADLVQAQRVRTALVKAVQSAMHGFDAMLTANVLGTAPLLDGGGMPNAMRVFPFNLTGHPALALPIGAAGNGLPFGMQLVGQPFGEAALCQLGDAFERNVYRAPPPPQERPIR